MNELKNTVVKRHTFGTRLMKYHGIEKVIILGAGVSKSMDIPLATDLLKEMFHWDGACRPLDILYDFLEFAYPTFRRSGGHWYPLAEDVLGMLVVAQQYNGIRGRSRGYRWRKGLLEQVGDRFLRLLGGYLWSFQNSTMDSYHPLRRFVRMFRNRAVYVTFNYDLGLETALSCEGIPYSYGIPIPTKGVSVIKPHGSINWFYKTEHFPKGESENWFDLGSKIVCNCFLLPHKEWVDRPPAIVPPSPFKTIEVDEFRRMWTSFSSVVHSIADLTIVGYSLPQADRLSRLILRRSVLASRKHRIFVVNPDRDIGRVYKENLSDTVFLIPRMFEEWVQILEDST